MKLLCYGDSNTFGYDPRSVFGCRYDKENRWTDILAAQTGWEIINAGQNGREIPRRSFELESAKELICRHKPDLTVVMLGTNDLLQGASAKETANRMENFLKLLLPHHKNILLVAPPPLKRGAWVPTDKLVAESIQLAEEYRLLAQKLNIPFVDTRHWNIELTFDGVHLTESGHHVFANQLIEYI
jgi:lysophospholipase L1-like esterase